MAANQHIGRQEEVDPTGAGIDRHTEGMPLTVEKRIAGRQRKPRNRVEVHRGGQVVERLHIPDTYVVKQTQANLMTPNLVLGSQIDRGAQHLGLAFGSLHPVELQLAEIKLRIMNLTVDDLHAGKRLGFGHLPTLQVFLSPRNEAQVVHGERELQIGNHVVRHTQIDGKTVTRRPFVGRDVEIVERIIFRPVGTLHGAHLKARHFERTVRVDIPTILLQFYIEPVDRRPRTARADEKLTPSTEINLIRQRKRVTESGLEISLCRGFDIVDNGLVPSVLEKVEQRIGHIGLRLHTHIQIERPECLMILAECTETDDIDPGIGSEHIFRAQISQRLGRRNILVEQRYQTSVHRIKNIADGEVTGNVDLHTAQYGNIHIAAQRSESRVKLAAESRTLHKVGTRRLCHGRTCDKCRNQSIYDLFHMRNPD